MAAPKPLARYREIGIGSEMEELLASGRSLHGSATDSEPTEARQNEDEMASDREYVDLKLAAADARVDTKFAEINGRLDRLNDSIMALSGQVVEARNASASLRSTILTSVIATGVASVLALGALFVSMATYGDAIFSRGMSVRDLVNSVTKEQAERAAQTQPNQSKK